jgi:hypothetical protein
MQPFSDNPFAVFTFIAAPAVLTNAAAVMSLTTSNRIARAVDRARALVTQLSGVDKDDPQHSFHVREVEVARRRAVLLIRALGFFQLACGSFAASTLLALFGAVFALLDAHILREIALAATLVSASVAVAGIVTGATGVVIESRLAYTILSEETVYLLESLNETGPPKPVVPPS